MGKTFTKCAQKNSIMSVNKQNLQSRRTSFFFYCIAEFLLIKQGRLICVLIERKKHQLLPSMPTKSHTSTSGNEETCSKCQTRNTSSSTVTMENINPNMSFTNVISSRLSEQD